MKNKLLLLFLLLGTALNAQLNQTDAKGRKQGPWQKKYEGSAVLKYKGQFKDDKPIGTFTYYYPSNKVMAIIKHKEGSPRSVGYYYHENGSLMSHGIFHNEKKDSVWVIFGPSERLSSVERYDKGVLHGQKVVYFIPEDPSDKSQVPSAVYNYVQGVLDGEFKEYHINGKTKTTGQYVKGKKHGVWNHYHINARQSHLYRYKNGVKHGWCYSYDISGKEEYKAYFYYGRHLEGKQLEEKLRQLKQLGVNPNE
jgi:antitoxin component YwqK of YwqJK toxin-antitoxin module